MAEYIERKAAMIICDKHYRECLRMQNWAGDSVAYNIADDIRELPTADVVEVETVAQMLCDAVGDECPCNYSPTDEWLTEVCELQDECPNPKEKLGCWKEYIKHYGERKET